MDFLSRPTKSSKLTDAVVEKMTWDIISTIQVTEPDEMDPAVLFFDVPCGTLMTAAQFPPALRYGSNCGVSSISPAEDLTLGSNVEG